MPLQKSFSDQNHSANPRQRPSYRRNKSCHAPPAEKKASGPLQEKPPIPISTATKNKLTAFQFEGDVSAGKCSNPIFSLISDDEKENSVIFENKAFKTSTEKPKKAPWEYSKVSGQVHDDVPSTPTGRLALPDLIGMGDIRRDVKDLSPEERLEWDHGMDLHSSRAAPFPGAKRVRKRARSSSPVSSPAQSSAHLGASNELTNKHFDPGSELWGRYSTHGSAAPTPQAVPALAHLMQTSSPQTSRDGSTPRSAVFRRTNSCGIQFPKRRKIESDDVFGETTTLGPSRLSVLIERIQEGLSQPQKPQVGTGSPKSSQARDEHSSVDPGEDTQESPTTRPQRLVSTRHDENLELLEREAVIIQTKPTITSTASSDYGDDFEDDDLDECVLAVVQSKNSHSAKNRIPENSSKAFPPKRSLNRSPATRAPSQMDREATSPLSDYAGADDEFGEFDDEEFTVDIEHIVSQFDKTSVQKDHSALVRAIIPSEPQGNLMTTESDDEYGDDGLNDLDFEAAEATATQSMNDSASILLPSTHKVKAIQRYLVTNILDSEYETRPGRSHREKILLLQVENTKVNKLVHLRGIWMESPVTRNAFVHVIGSFDKKGQCIVDDNKNMLILHPDHLISSTVVADSFGCTRRAVLQERIKATIESSAPLVYGTILHEIFQAAMLANRWDTEWLRELIDRVANQHLEDLYTIRIEVPHAVEYLLSKMPELQAWAELFISSQPNPAAIVKAGNAETATMCISNLLDVEEHVWSPMYGLKGNIDATVQVTMQDDTQRRTLTVPFEIKTGKYPSAAHRAQTALYSLLLSDRYDVQIAYGILYYMETSETIRIPAIRHELRHMIMQRNELACYVRERSAQLPPMLKNENACNRCYAKVPCFIYHKLADDGTGETSVMKAKFDEVVKHLTPKHKEFFLKWDNLLTKEEKESLKFRRELWTMLSSEREKLGRCFSNVVIEPDSAHEDQNSPKINRFRYNLIKETPVPGFSFLDSQIIVGEPIVISDEQGHFALANGYVTHVRKGRITVAVDRRLHNARTRRPGFREDNNQVFASIMSVTPEGDTQVDAEVKMTEEPMKYRLDKDEFSNGMATVRNNLIQVMAEGPIGSRHIRNLVVDLHAPRFKTTSTAYVLKDRDSLNVDQRRAIQKVMSAEDYALVLGMPGTGKTTTIAHIIRALVSQGKSVLLTSYTHTAVDNILLKLKDDNIPILRLGTISKVATEVQEFATLGVDTRTSFQEITSAWHDTPVVATTCLGINHALFNERTFDYCIVDEASQITLPVCIGPIRLAKTFILVGDHNQLPPLVQNEEARIGGLDISLFKHLSDTHPSSVVYLEHQYRMCEEVMALSNNLIYNGRLKCGSQSVAERSITIPNMNALKAHHYTPSTLPRTQKSLCLGGSSSRCWLRHLLDPGTKVSFINTDPLLPLSREEAKGSRIVNPTEASVCVQLVEALITVGVPATDIGVMTHYRSQLALLKHGLRSHSNVEMHTADRFQGRDKEVIILSLVRSNEALHIGELLKDWRRINVAFTRAKTKLLVIGSRETLKGRGPNAQGEEEMVAKFLGLMESRQWVFDLPTGSLGDHLFEEKATQTQLPPSAKNAVEGTNWKQVIEKVRDLHGDTNMKDRDIESPFATEKKRKAAEDDENVDPSVKAEALLAKVGKIGKASFGISGKRSPKKRVQGQKPFRIPTMGVLRDVTNDSMG